MVRRPLTPFVRSYASFPTKLDRGFHYGEGSKREEGDEKEDPGAGEEGRAAESFVSERQSGCGPVGRADFTPSRSDHHLRRVG
jgi:hypothetical protein